MAASGVSQSSGYGQQDYGSTRYQAQEGKYDWYLQYDSFKVLPPVHSLAARTIHINPHSHQDEMLGPLNVVTAS